MKSLYQCERCGATFTDYDECSKCETSHAINFDWDMTYPFDNAQAVYEKGKEIPVSVRLGFTNSIYNEDTQEWENVLYIGQYVLKKEFPGEGDKIMAERKRKAAEDKEKWEKERAEREAAKAIEEAAAEADQTEETDQTDVA